MQIDLLHLICRSCMQIWQLRERQPARLHVVGFTLIPANMPNSGAIVVSKFRFVSWRCHAAASWPKLGIPCHTASHVPLSFTAKSLCYIWTLEPGVRRLTLDDWARFCGKGLAVPISCHEFALTIETGLTLPVLVSWIIARTWTKYRNTLQLYLTRPRTPNWYIISRYND
jgi:hypothetical protein